MINGARSRRAAAAALCLLLATLGFGIPAGAQGGRLNPLAMFVHGGGWVSGDASMGAPLSAFFVDRHYGYSSIDYPKLPAVPLSTMVADVQRQMRISVQTGPSIVIGHSAGAHLVATAAFSPGAPMVRCLILLDGIGYDLAGLLVGAPGLQLRLGLNPQTALKYSPTALVPDSNRRPVVYIAAGGDARDTAAQAEQFARILEGNGMKVTLAIFPELTHNDLRTAFLDPASPVSKSVAKFLLAHPRCAEPS